MSGRGIALALWLACVCVLAVALAVVVFAPGCLSEAAWTRVGGCCGLCALIGGTAGGIALCAGR